MSCNLICLQLRITVDPTVAIVDSCRARALLARKSEAADTAAMFDVDESVFHPSVKRPIKVVVPGVEHVNLESAADSESKSPKPTAMTIPRAGGLSVRNIEQAALETGSPADVGSIASTTARRPVASPSFEPDLPMQPKTFARVRRRLAVRACARHP